MSITYNIIENDTIHIRYNDEPEMVIDYFNLESLVATLNYVVNLGENVQGQKDLANFLAVQIEHLTRNN